jgi:hypothetical protein
MSNKAKITGNDNTIVQDTKNSLININSNNRHTSKGFIISIVVAILGVLVAIIIGWDNFIKFFN